MKHLIASLLILMSVAVNATTVTYNATPPTTRVDGTPLLATEIAKYKVYEYLNGTLVNTYESATFPITGNDLPVGAISAQTSTVDTHGQEGPKSPIINVHYPPQAPSGFAGKITITIEIEQ